MGKASNLITSLKSTREARGMTQQELAERIGVRRETILHLENNRYNPSLEMALKIARDYIVLRYNVYIKFRYIEVKGERKR